VCIAAVDLNFAVTRGAKRLPAVTIERVKQRAAEHIDGSKQKHPSGPPKQKASGF